MDGPSSARQPDVAQPSRSTARLARIARTLNQMMTKRGYEVDDDLDAAEAVIYDRRTDLERAYEPISAEGTYGPCAVYFAADKGAKVGVGPIRSIVQRMRSDDHHHAIIVAEVGLTPPAKKACRMIQEEGVRIETFVEAELLYDVMEHEFVPNHTVLTEAEKELLLRRFRLDGDATLLPYILTSDPVARYLGLTHGQVVKIERPSTTSGKGVTYRVVK